MAENEPTFEEALEAWSELDEEGEDTPAAFDKLLALTRTPSQFYQVDDFALTSAEREKLEAKRKEITGE